MTTNDFQHQTSRYSRQCGNHKNNRFAFGALIIMIGGIILVKRLGLFVFPFHVWPLILLAIGIYTGIKHQFRHFGSWVLIILGILFTIPKFMILGTWSTHLIAPLLLIALGVYMILKPKRRFYRQHNIATSTTGNDTVDIDVTFGERNCIVTAQNFKGGTINNTFGETKLNLMHADNMEPIVLDVKVSFGTLDILIPSHWDVEFQVSNSMASVEDKRYMRVLSPEEKRLLIIKGSCSFGSISVKSI